MTITPGKLRALTQPTIMLRMEMGVDVAPGEGNHEVFGVGVLVYAQYIGNGRLLLTPVGTSAWPAAVVMASALNSAASIVDGDTVATALDRYPE